MKCLPLLFLVLMLSGKAFAQTDDTLTGTLVVRKEADMPEAEPSGYHPLKSLPIMLASQLPELDYEGGYYAWLAANLQYPQEALDNKWDGEVKFIITVTDSGTVRDITLQKTSKHAVLDLEGLRLMQSLPRWKPGMYEGRPMSLRVSVPVVFVHPDKYKMPELDQ